MKEWQTFVRKFSDMRGGRRLLFIKDLTEGPAKYDTRQVIAQVAREKSALKNPDVLWVRSESGIRHPDPWYLVVESELEEYIPGKPWNSVFDSLEMAEKSLL